MFSVCVVIALILVLFVVYCAPSRAFMFCFTFTFFRRVCVCSPPLGGFSACLRARVDLFFVN
jgi:hypothetical protein